MKATDITLNTTCSRFSPVGDGIDSLIIRQILEAKDRNFIIHVARDDQRMVKMQKQLSFCLQDPLIMLLPAWDCLP